MKRIKYKMIEPGDIIFTARPAKLSKIIRAFSNGSVSHAIICVSYGSFIDATSDAVQARNFQRMVFQDDEKVFHYRLKEPLDREIIQTVIKYIRSEVPVRYSRFEAINAIVNIFKFRSRRQFCSRLIARAYEQAGIKLVEDADYCTPEVLRRSSMLQKLTIAFETVSKEEFAWLSNCPDLTQRMREAQNTVLEAARRIDSSVESFEDLYLLLIKVPIADRIIANVLESSGYLEIWKAEVKSHRWRYCPGLIDELMASPESVRDYCIGTVKEAYSGEEHFPETLVQLQRLQANFPRESFRLLVALYQTLVTNSQNRREIAYHWLAKHFPRELAQYMEEIEPHSPSWWSTIECVQPELAEIARNAGVSEDNAGACTSCGGQPAYSYRLVNGVETMLGVPSLRLCEGCLGCYRDKGLVLMRFLSES